MMLKVLLSLVAMLLTSVPVWAAGGGEAVDLTASLHGQLGLLLFAGAYVLVVFEEKLHLRKSKPTLLAAGAIWVLVALGYGAIGDTHSPHRAIQANLLEYAELFLFLLAAMTYINALEERNAFQALRSWLVSRGFSLRMIFWLTGVLAFFISPIADNLTTALLMGAVVMAVGGSDRRFVSLACINVVVAANAGGAFSPFGDITTLMVWQKGKLDFGEFLVLFVPSLVNWLVPALIMNGFLGRGRPAAVAEEVGMKFGARRIAALFLLTIVTAVSFHNFLHLPPAAGMMLGLGYLSLFAYFLKRREGRLVGTDNPLDVTTGNQPVFDLFRNISRAEWDTLLFFYGVVLCVGGLGQFGYLALASEAMYLDLGPTAANVLVGILSALVDNIPVMYAVLTMNPQMADGQWLLVTLTAGVGGSLLSIGSAAGVALMGTARGAYTFGSHLKWTWAVALGYGASIAVHLFLNAGSFGVFH